MAQRRVISNYNHHWNIAYVDVFVGVVKAFIHETF